MSQSSNDINSESQGEYLKIIFKPKKKKPLRKRKLSDSNEESSEGEVNTNIENLKLLQSLRKRPHGVNIMGLPLGKTPTDDVSMNESFKPKAGGMINMQALKNGKLKQVDDAYDTGIGTQFSVETNKRDEDDEMMKYIEEELAKRKGKMEMKNEENEEADLKTKYLTPEEAALQALPNHLKESSYKKNEEMLSNQMLNGIPEVDLGIEVKIKNIEATEEAKLRLLWEQNKKKEGPSQFVPTNMASNFTQHNRFNIDISEIPIATTTKTNANEENQEKKSKEDKATDDYHYERFKKQFRRH